MCAKTKVDHIVIVWISVNVVNAVLSVYRSQECFGYESVNEIAPRFLVFIQTRTQIPFAVLTELQYLRLTVTSIAQAPDASCTAYLVQSLIPFDVLPNFIMFSHVSKTLSICDNHAKKIARVADFLGCCSIFIGKRHIILTKTGFIMQIKVQDSQRFKVYAENFAIGVSESGYQLEFSVDGENYTAIGDAVPAGENVIVTGSAKELTYRLNGNSGETKITF